MNYRPSPMVLRRGRLVPRFPQPAPAGAVPVAVAEAEGGEDERPVSGRVKILLLLFLLSLMVPISADFGTVRMTPYTALLLVSFIPLFFMWLGKKYSPIVLPDVLLFLFCAWSVVGVIIHHGFELTIEPNGIQVLETFGSYLMGRMLVRNHNGMRFMVTVLTVALSLMLPFIVIEAVTGKKLLIEAWSLVGQTPGIVSSDQRWGLTRAQGAFEHPILMGVFCASIMSIAFQTWQGKGNLLLRKLAAPVATASSIFSLSTGALLALNVQFGLIAWGRIFRENPQRWKVLILLLVAMYVTIDLLSNRSPFHVFVSYATFNQTSSYNRILIWQFGTAEAWRHPIIGIGFNDWQRPSYMSNSMDNFWLVQAVRYGIPAFLLIAGTLVTIVRRLAAADLPTHALRQVRLGIIFSLVSFATAMISVHLWNASYVWFCFLMGACVWPMVLPRTQAASASLDTPRNPRGIRISGPARQQLRPVRGGHVSA